MYESCLRNFLKSYDHNHGERHSDSSDFENDNDIPIESPKHGKHRLLLDKSSFMKPKRDVNTYQASNKNTYNNTKIKYHIKKFSLRKCRKHLSNTNHDESIGKYQSDELNVSAKNNKNNRGDQSSLHLMEKSYSKTYIRNKVIPCLSTLFRRSYNCKNHLECIEEDRTHIKNNCDKNYPYNNCQKPRKIKRGYREHTVQPVYDVNENGNGFLFPNRIQQVSLSKDKSVVRNVDYELSLDISSIRSVSENDNRHKNIVKEVKQTLEKEIRNYYSINACSRNEDQQFPSKSQLKSPYQVFTSSSCQAERTSVVSNGVHSLPSTSSQFWDYLAGKLKFQVEKAEVKKTCNCTPPLAPCCPSNCEYKISKDTINLSNPNLFPKESSCCKLPPNSSNCSLNRKKKKNQELKSSCKCTKNRKKKDSKMNDGHSMTEETKPCQAEHEEIVSCLGQKYKGQILCIHNPPCVLINGCLNLPPLKSNEEGSYFPVTQIKNSSFSKICRKMKITKEKKSEKEQASQYHPPYGELRKLLPEFGDEKIIQSVCNHEPPCEIVRGCYRAKYNPKLQNSCIHVPSCDKLPECLLEKKDKFQNNICLHNPRCAELPLCSRKYIVLTAKVDVCTQVKPTAKMMCLHEPPCFMIPKCLACAICSDFIPVGPIPGCAHQPSCEMIPACCRNSTKETVSVPSQYPNKSCPIV